jgi:deoxyribonuclease I
VKPATTAIGSIIGNRNSKIYHLPNCPDYPKVSERNRVPFRTEADALAAGYRKAKNCP